MTNIDTSVSYLIILYNLQACQLQQLLDHPNYGHVKNLSFMVINIHEYIITKGTQPFLNQACA